MGCRIRFLFERRGFSCFVRHVELPQLLGRVTRRAKLDMEYTQGMSPRPHIVLGGALPVGIVSTYELADFWFREHVEIGEAIEKINANIPGGFKFLKGKYIALDDRGLNKCYNACRYWLCPRDTGRINDVAHVLSTAFDKTRVADVIVCADGIEVVTLEPSQFSAGAMMNALIDAEIISGWEELCVARICQGNWDASLQRLIPLM